MSKFLSVLAITAATACAPATQKPIPSTAHEALQSPPSCAAVMLPGKGDTGESYSQNKVVERLQARQRDIEIVTVDAHFGYYRERNLLPRLEEDVLSSLRARGIETIWLVGTSMGGIGALLMAQEHPELVDGIILVAPYLGRKNTLKSVEEAGGLAAWQPPEDQSEWDVSLWAWLKGYTNGERRPPIYLAYGEQDGGAEAYELIAYVLPTGHVFTMEGGHGWKVWNPLWDEMLPSVAPFCPL
jgi:pimeloyl-ACP methyl ester carboxylesterase